MNPKALKPKCIFPKHLLPAGIWCRSSGSSSSKARRWNQWEPSGGWPWTFHQIPWNWLRWVRGQEQGRIPQIKMETDLVGGLEHFLFSIIHGIPILPIDELIFFRGVGQPPTSDVPSIFRDDTPFATWRPRPLATWCCMRVQRMTCCHSMQWLGESQAETPNRSGKPPFFMLGLEIVIWKTI